MRYHNHTAHSKLEKKFLKENVGKIMRHDVGDGCLDYEASEVAHAGEQVCVAMIICDGPRCPQIDMQKKEWTGDGPRKDKLLALARILVSQHTVGAHAHPGGDIAAHFRPKES